MDVDIPCSSIKRIVLDTTIQLDRIKTPARREHIRALLQGYDLVFSTSIGQLEFKATFIQECITIHSRLCRAGVRFTRIRDEMIESNHPQAKLRGHIFNNFLQVWGSAFRPLTVEKDREMAERAKLLLEIKIPRVFDAFAKQVDGVLRDRIGCDRSIERPTLRNATFTPNLPKCKRGTNKTCNVETMIRKDGPRLIARMNSLEFDSEQLQRSFQQFEEVIQMPMFEMSHAQCRNCGDALIMMESGGLATHSLSTNARDWDPLSKAVGIEFVKMEYPKER